MVYKLSNGAQDDNVEETPSTSIPVQPEWIFWIFGTPQRPQAQPFTKCLVHPDEITFESLPRLTIPIKKIQSCKMNRSSAGFSYHLSIKLFFNEPYPNIGNSLHFILVDPLLAMWGNDRPSPVEYQAFEQLINSLQSGRTPNIDPNPYRRAYQARNIKIREQDIQDAHRPPLPAKRPNLLLIGLLIFLLFGLIIFLNMWFR